MTDEAMSEEEGTDDLAAEEEEEIKGFISAISNAAAEEEEEEERFVEGRIQIEGIGDLERGGSTLFYLHQEDNRNILIILSANRETNKDAFEILLENELIECQAAPQIAVCQTDDPEGEDLPPSVRSDRINKILIV